MLKLDLHSKLPNFRHLSTTSAMTKKVIPEFWKKMEIPERFLNIYYQGYSDLFQNFYFFRYHFKLKNFTISLC